MAASTLPRITALLTGGLLAGGLACGSAQATAIHAARAEATLSITGITNLDTPGDLLDLFISGDAFTGNDVFAADVFGPGGTSTAGTDGFAEVDAADPFDMGTGDGLSLFSEGLGSATHKAGSIALHDTEGVIFLDNFSFTDTFVIDFSLGYALSVDAAVDLPAREFASAIALLDVFTDFDDVLFDELASFSDLGGGAFATGPVSLDFSVTLDPDSSATVTLLASAEGSASGSSRCMPK